MIIFTMRNQHYECINLMLSSYSWC